MEFRCTCSDFIMVLYNQVIKPWTLDSVHLTCYSDFKTNTFCLLCWMLKTMSPYVLLVASSSELP